MTHASFEPDPVIAFIVGRDGQRLSLASAVGVAFVSCLTMAALATAAALPPGWAFAGFVVIAVAVSAFTSPGAAVVVALVAFLFANGFAFDTAGTLAWHGEADLLRLVCMVALAVTASLLGHGLVGGRASKGSFATARGVEHG